jgi:hypothetical protein
MSSITFDADLNVDKLSAGVKQSSQNVKQWAKDVEKAGGQADAGLNKMTKSFKDAITEQKALIKSIEGDVKNLQKVYDNASPGKVKSAMGSELGSAKRALSEEQAQLKKLQDEAIANNKREDGSEKSLITTLSRWAAGIFSVAAAMKIGKAIIAANTETTIAFEKITGAASSAVGYFFKVIASGDWSNFSSGMDRAIRGATEYVDAMANLRNEENAQKIKSSEDDVKIAELRDKTYDKDKKNTGARFAALQEIIELEKEKYTQEAALAKSAYDINLKKAASDSGLTTKQIENFLKEYKSLEDLIKVGKQYNEITKLTRTPGLNAAYVADLLKERNALEGNAREAGNYVTQIGKITPEVRKQLSDAAASANEAIAAYGQKNRRDKMQAAEAWNTLWDAWMTEIDAQNKVWEERNDIGKEIAEQQKLLNDAIGDGNKKEAKEIAEKIVLLEAELKARQANINAALMAATVRESTPSKITGLKPPILLPGGLKIPNTLAGAPVTTEVDYIPGTAMLSEAGRAKQKKDSADADKVAKKSLEDQLELRQQIVKAATDLVSQIGQEIGLNEKSTALLNAGLNAFNQLAEGDLPGAAVSMLSGIIAQIPSSASRFEKQIEHINQLLEKQQRLIEQSEQKGGQAAAREGGLTDLEIKAAAQKAEYERLQKAADTHWDLLGWRQDKADAAYATWQATTVEIENSNQALTDFYTNTTASAVADAIVQGFQDGKTSAADFADTFNGFMTNAIDSALKDTLLIDLRPWYEQFKIAMADSVLDDAEKAALKAQYDEIIAKANADRQAAYDAAGISPAIGSASQSGMVGTLMKTISEDTASEWVGLARRQADDLRVMKDYSREGIKHLVRLAAIETNTFNTVAELQKLNVKTDTVISNTKPAYSAPLG